MIKSIVRELHWAIDFIANMYIDDTDVYGIEFWYNDLKELNEKLKPKK